MDAFSCLGKLDAVYKMQPKPNTIPVVWATRPVPHALKDKFKSELESLISLEVIADYLKPGEWLNSIRTVLGLNVLLGMYRPATVQHSHYKRALLFFKNR